MPAPAGVRHCCSTGKLTPQQIDTRQSQAQKFPLPHAGPDRGRQHRAMLRSCHPEDRGDLVGG